MTEARTTWHAVSVLLLALSAGLFAPEARSSDLQPWTVAGNALIVDAYEMNSIDWTALLSDTRIAGFIAKASDGLPESFSCTGAHRGDTVAHCKTIWRKYAVSRELYRTRRMIAKASGLLWGAYHMARPGNPVDQANHFLAYAEPAKDEMMVLDLEGIDAEKFMSLADAQIFAAHVKIRTGRYPVLYTNHATATVIAAHRLEYPLLSRLPLWYARYKPAIRGVFPLGHWETYALWQFSSDANCSKRRCPYRVPGTLTDIDVNVAAATKAQLSRTWSRGALVPARPAPQPLLLARASAGTASMPGASLSLDLTVTAAIAATGQRAARRADTDL